MIAREYLTLQAVTLLKLAKITSSPKAAAALAIKAADLQAQAGDSVNRAIRRAIGAGLLTFSEAENGTAI